MQKVKSLSELKNTIAQLEYKQKVQWIDLKDTLGTAFDSLKPINLLRSTYNEFLSTPNMAEKLISSTIGLGTGYLTKKLIVKKSGNMFRNFAGGLAQIMITNFVSRNTGPIKKIGASLIQKYLVKKKTVTDMV